MWTVCLYLEAWPYDRPRPSFWKIEPITFFYLLDVISYILWEWSSKLQTGSYASINLYLLFCCLFFGKSHDRLGRLRAKKSIISKSTCFNTFSSSPSHPSAFSTTAARASCIYTSTINQSISGGTVIQDSKRGFRFIFHCPVADELPGLSLLLT